MRSPERRPPSHCRIQRVIFWVSLVSSRSLHIFSLQFKLIFSSFPSFFIILNLHFYTQHTTNNVNTTRSQINSYQEEHSWFSCLKGWLGFSSRRMFCSVTSSPLLPLANSQLLFPLLSNCRSSLTEINNGNTSRKVYSTTTKFVYLPSISRHHSSSYLNVFLSFLLFATIGIECY